MSERVPLYVAGQAAYIITASDGRLFRCSLETVGRTKPELRWIFRDTQMRYIGPPSYVARYLDELQGVVEEWWQGKKAIGYVGVNAAILRAKLAAEDN